MATIDERIKLLEEKLKQEKAKKQKVDAMKKAAEVKLQRTQDTRRKILIGAFMLDRMEKNEETKTKMIGQLDQYLTRADDRQLFGLEPTPVIKSELA